MTVSKTDLDKLWKAAVEARGHAYAPYSNHCVGAALLGKSGEIYSGSNIENASIGLTVCAERGALQAAVTQGERDLQALVVVTGYSPPGAPCGACRQVLAELLPMSTPIHLANLEGIQKVVTLKDLLPYAFTPADVKKG